MAFMGMSKKPLSAHEMRRQLGMKRYQPVWYMMKKIRKAMGQRDDRYLLSDIVEFDEAYFSKATPGRTKLKRGKGSQRKQNVAVMAEAARLEDIDTGKKSTACRYFKMKVLETSKADGVNSEVSNRLDEKTVVLSDKATNFVDIMNYVEGHIMFDSSEETTNDQLKWVHIAISNAKRTLLGIYHQVAGKNLQDYLNEFCYKLNRRYFGNRLYDRIIIAVASGTWCTKAD